MNWLRQTPDNPLFPDVLWSRPENKRFAGKLLIIGGHAQSINAVSAAFIAASKAGAGTIRLLLPASLQKTVGAALPEADFAPSTPIGSFSQKALAQLMDSSDWADAVLLAGDLGRNSETSILLEKFADKYRGLLCLAGDSMDYFVQHSETLLDREKTLLITNLPQLQKLDQPRTAIRQQADLSQLVSTIGELTENLNAEVITFHENQVIVGLKGKVSTTKTGNPINGAEVAGYASVWRLQQPEKPFEALTSSAFKLSQQKNSV